MIKSALRPSTQQTYSAGQDSYLKFCNVYKFAALPLNEETLMKYVYHLAFNGLRTSSVKVYIAAVYNLSVTSGYGKPVGFERLHLAIRSLEINSEAPKQKMPITYEVLQKLRDLILDYDNKVMWAAMTLAHFALLRASEFTLSSPYDANMHLSLNDFKVCQYSEPVISLHIKRSKTDHFNNGFLVYIGCTSTPVCAHCALVDYVPESVSRHGKEPTRPLFLFADRTPLIKNVFLARLRLMLAQAGISSEHISGHSFRIGGATSAAAAGLSDWEIQMLGRWKSDAYQRYIRAPPLLLAGLAKRMIPLAAANSKFSMRNPYITNCLNGPQGLD